MTPLFWAVAALLVVSGAAKVRRPAPATEALADLGWRLPPAVVRALAGAEAAVGGAALLWGGWPMAVLVAGAYAVFVAFSITALARDGVRSCGCFGETDAPVGRLHLALATAGVAIATGGAATSSGGAVAVLAGPSAADVLGVVLAGLAVWLAYAAFTLLPALEAQP